MTVETVRLSASLLASIQDKGDRYALLLNKHSLSRGERVFTPLGGAVELTALGKTALMTLLHVQAADYEKGADLRIKNVPRDAIDAFIRWFAGRDGRMREIHPGRELLEELITESHTLPDSYRERIEKKASYRHLGYGSEFDFSERSGMDTVRVADVCQVTLPGDIVEALSQATEKPDSPLAFVSPQEIAVGHTQAGTPIGSNASFLIRHLSYPENPIAE